MRVLIQPVLAIHTADPWRLQPETSPARIGLDQALQRLALPTPADIIECSSVCSMQQLIQLTDAIMVRSETALRECLKMGLVAALPVELDVQLALFGLLLRMGEHMNRDLGLLSFHGAVKPWFSDRSVKYL